MRKDQLRIIMKTAHKLRKLSAQKHCCKPSEIDFSSCLKLAWETFRNSKFVVVCERADRKRLVLSSGLSLSSGFIAPKHFKGNNLFHIPTPKKASEIARHYSRELPECRVYATTLYNFITNNYNFL